MLDRLGGPPGRYVAAAIAVSLVAFPMKALFTDRGDPLGDLVTNSALQGVVWALGVLAAEALLRGRGRTSREYRRRGARVGLAVGVPFLAALAGYAAVVGRPLFAALFGVALTGVVTVAVVQLRRA
jgi:hypothetical protein